MRTLYTLLISMLLICSCEKQEQKPSIKPPVAAPEDTTPTPGTQVENHIIVGYATYWDSVMPDPTNLTHINYSFAHIKNDFESLDIKTSSRLKKIAALKDTNPDLKVLLAVGGWGAGNFSEMAADENHRKKFCENCLAAINQYNLDGIDLDWEYPTSSSAGITSVWSVTESAPAFFRTSIYFCGAAVII